MYKYVLCVKLAAIEISNHFHEEQTRIPNLNVKTYKNNSSAIIHYRKNFQEMVFLHNY